MSLTASTRMHGIVVATISPMFGTPNWLSFGNRGRQFTTARHQVGNGDEVHNRRIDRRKSSRAPNARLTTIPTAAPIAGLCRKLRRQRPVPCSGACNLWTPGCPGASTSGFVGSVALMVRLGSACMAKLSNAVKIYRLEHHPQDRRRRSLGNIRFESDVPGLTIHYTRGIGTIALTPDKARTTPTKPFQFLRNPPGQWLKHVMNRRSEVGQGKTLPE